MAERAADGALPVTVRAAGPDDVPAVVRVLSDSWGSPVILSRGARHDASAAPAFVAERAGRLVGLATYVLAGREVELLSLDALEQGQGIGSALLEAVAAAASSRGASRLVLVTTNDNLGALRFYQRRGFRLTALHAGAADRARQEKPFIPTVGIDGIPLHDELELALELTHDPAGDPGAGSSRTRPAADPVQ